MANYYYLATNTFGSGRSLKRGNGWEISAYEDKTTRDRIYDKLSYKDTGCTIMSPEDISDFAGPDNWMVFLGIRTDHGGFYVGPRT